MTAGTSDGIGVRAASFRKRWRIAIDTAIIVAAIMGARVAVDVFSLEFITPGPLLTSVVAGGLFVIGVLVAGTLAEYKEAERMPAELAAALDNIDEDARGIKHTAVRFDLDRLHERLAGVVVALRQDLATLGSRNCLGAINELSDSFLELEQLDIPPNYIVRLRGEQGTIRRIVLRMYHIQRIEFLPSAFILIQTIIVLIIGVLAFAKIEPGYEAVVLLLVISYFFVYLTKLLKILDTPFRVDEHTMDDVSLFLLREFTESLAASAKNDEAPQAPIKETGVN